MELIIRDKIKEQFKRNNLFSNKQYGFTTGRSTTLQLLKILDKWTEILDAGGQIDIMYMDFMKAFDKVPHRRFIAKNTNLRNRGPISWMNQRLLIWTSSSRIGKRQIHQMGRSN